MDAELGVGNKVKALTNRTGDFCDRNTCPSWLSRKGSDDLKDLVWSIMSIEQREAYSTEGLSMLTEIQLLELKELANEKYLNRAGINDPEPGERKRRRAVYTEEMVRARAEAVAQQSWPRREQKREYASLFSDDEEQTQPVANKRPRSDQYSPSNQEVPSMVAESCFRRASERLNAIDGVSGEKLGYSELEHTGHQYPPSAWQDVLPGAKSGQSGNGTLRSYRAGQVINLTPVANPADIGSTHKDPSSRANASRIGNTSSLPPPRSYSTGSKRRRLVSDLSVEEDSEPATKRRELSRFSLDAKVLALASAFATLRQPRSPGRHVRPSIVSARVQRSSRILQGLLGLTSPSLDNGHVQQSGFDIAGNNGYISKAENNAFVSGNWGDEHKPLSSKPNVKKKKQAKGS